MSFRPVIAGMVNVSGGASSVAAITSGTITGITGFALRDTSAAFDLTFGATSTTPLTAGRSVTWDVNNTSQTLKFTGASTVTFPSGTATLAKLGANTFTATQTLPTSAALNLNGGGNAAIYCEGADVTVIFGNPVSVYAAGGDPTLSFYGRSCAFVSPSSGIAQQRSTTQAQAFSVANTWTSSTNYEFGVLDWQGAANVFRIGTQKGSGGGTARAMSLITDDTARINIGASGELGFFGSAATAKPTISGARNDPEAALLALLTGLTNLGLITNSTTAS